MWRWHAIRAGVPKITAATTDLFVPQSLNWDVLGGVNFQKGCYPGQDIVARTQYLGRLKERLFAFRTSAENVQAALDWHGGGGGTVADLFALPSRRRLDRERRVSVDEALELCGLMPLANERAGLLPIAQARLVELARAIVDTPRLLLLDEPTSGLGEVEASQELTTIHRGSGFRFRVQVPGAGFLRHLRHPPSAARFRRSGSRWRRRPSDRRPRSVLRVWRGGRRRGCRSA